MLPSLVMPVCFGLILYLGLAYSIETRQLTHEETLRYLTGHPISQVTVGMFFVGVASVALIALDVANQFLSERRIRLKPSPGPEQDLAATTEFFASQLSGLPKRFRDHYLFQRIYAVLSYIDRSGSTVGVEAELKYLSELDLERQSQRYSLVRILIWATPMLGFLGTVLGISQALGGISVGPDNDFEQMMNGLRGNLYIAFDTTALALTLSMLLMFCQFVVDRFETQLLGLIDHRARTEISRRFDLSSTLKKRTSQVNSSQFPRPPFKNRPTSGEILSRRQKKPGRPRSRSPARWCKTTYLRRSTRIFRVLPIISGRPLSVLMSR